MISETVSPTQVALLGCDAPHLHPKFCLSVGAYVAAGQPVLHDRKRSEIAYVAPISGRITEMSYGPRRTLSACVIAADKNAPCQTTQPAPDQSTEAAVRAALLASGFWPAFRTRPFGLTPDPKNRPVAILVNAVQGSIAAPDPVVVLAGQAAAFRTGLSVLKRLTDGPLFVCQSPGDPLCPDVEGVEVTAFSGSTAAGLAGTQIDLLCPVGPHRGVWSIGYQDVAAIGHLFETGRFHADRVIAVSGAGVAQPTLVRAPLGISLADLRGGSNREVHMQPVNPNQGGKVQFLRRYDDQVVSDPAPKQPARDGWISRIFKTSDALFPTGAIESAIAPDILPVPMMRALSVGDSEAALRLGCLALVEEDVAALTQICTSRADYGVLLRQVLDDLMADGV